MLGRIYRITSPSHDAVYIGSTVQSLATRFNGHKRALQKYINNECAYISSFDILAYDDADIELIAEYDVANMNELRQREQHHMEMSDKPIVNRHRAVGIPEPYRSRLYRIEHRDELRAKRTAKHACDCGGSYDVTYRAKHFRTGRHTQWLTGQNPVEV